MKVRWTPAARADLANVWLKADSDQRRVITSAAQAIDNRLTIDAKNAGESRPGGRRIFFESPLGIAFRVDPTGAAVDVLRVWRIR
jgi:plasmid stabilization system protein ParE